MKRHVFFPSLLLLCGVLLAACQSPHSQAPQSAPGLEVQPLRPGIWMHISYNTSMAWFAPPTA